MNKYGTTNYRNVYNSNNKIINTPLVILKINKRGNQVNGRISKKKH